jgi:hypothetical protein
VDEPWKNSALLAINTIPNYPRQEVVVVPIGPGNLKSSATQLSKDGKTAYVLVRAGEADRLQVALTEPLPTQGASGGLSA